MSFLVLRGESVAGREGRRKRVEVGKAGLDGWQASTSERHVGERGQERGGT